MPVTSVIVHRMTLQYRAEVETSSGSHGVRPSFLVGLASCCSRAVPYLGLLVSTAVALLRLDSTGILTSASWAALKPVPARLPTVCRGTSSSTAATQSELAKYSIAHATTAVYSLE
jgi:hypothetical protein